MPDALDQLIAMVEEAMDHLQRAKELEAKSSPSAAWEAEARRELARRLCEIARYALPMAKEHV
jgi:hypothetical protein